MSSPTSANLYGTGVGTSSTNPFIEIFLPRDPTVNDLGGIGGTYQIQKRWWNTLTNDEWVLVSFSSLNGVVTANWVSVSSASTTETLTGNTGGAVSPDSLNNINVVGDGTTVTVVGDPSTHTLTISALAQAFNYTNVTHAQSPYTVLITDYYISVDCSAGGVDLKFPDVPTTNRIWVVKDRTGNASVNGISLTTVSGSVTIDGMTTFNIASNYASVNILANAVPTYELF